MTTAPLSPDPASFRDPSGRVYRYGDRIYRSVTHAGADNFDKVWSSGVLEKMTARGLLIETRLLGETLHMRNACDPDAVYMLEHPLLPLVTYPYEWPFTALKSAALAHLDLHIALLNEGFTLSDASAFNMQFRGAHALHIDALSVIPYREGMRWAGYRQFLQHFFNPLVFEASTGVSFAPFFRAKLDGMESGDLLRLLPKRWLLRPGIALHVIAPSFGERRISRGTTTETTLPSLPSARHLGMLRHLRSLVESLQPRRRTSWADYSCTTSYTQADAEHKRSIVRDFVDSLRPARLIDLGCNQGAYAPMMLEAGAGLIIGIDADRGAADQAFKRSVSQDLHFMPLVADLTNLPPSLGWCGLERAGLAQRLQGNAVIALAVLHHLAIARNIPLLEAIDFIVSLAPAGLIEFVPKTDPQVIGLLRFRDDIFPDYTEDAARTAIRSRATLVSEERIGTSGRILFRYERHG